MDAFTIQLSQWRIAVDRGIRVINATYKGNHPLFAPSGQLVWDSKQGRIGPDIYRQIYLQQMNQSVQQHQIGWDEFLLQYHDQSVAIGCFCAPGGFCHRHLLIPLLGRYAQWRGIPFTYYGELTPDTPNPHR